MSIVIDSVNISGSILYTIVSDVYNSLYASFEWYLNDVLVSRESTFLSISPLPTDNVYVIIKNYSNNVKYWHDGQFYGGTFTGNFSGGTFHYGSLNGVSFFEQNTRPKPFIKKI